MRVKKYKKPVVSIAATDGYNLYLDEERMNELPEESVNFLLLHELYHIILRHTFPKDMAFYEKPYWNIGYDLVANWLILSMETELKRKNLPVVPLSDSCVTKDDLSEDPSHRIVGEFLSQAKQQGILTDNPPLFVHIKWKSFEHMIPNNADFEFDILDGDDVLNPPTDADVQELLASSAKAAGNEGIPNNLQNLMEELTKGRRLPWYLIFKRYLEAIKESDDSDFCPPDKRMLYSGIILPAENELEKALNDALIVLDVSSSVDKEQLLEQIWQIKSVLNDLEFDGSILSFGGGVYQEAPITDKQSLKKFIDDLKVGGGTDWGDVVRRVKKRKRKAKPIIVFTDGYFFSFDKGLSNVVFITQDESPDELKRLGRVIQVKS
jgi:predicted metal-dependent peptidase